VKISLNWLNDYIDLKDVSLEEIVDKLTYAGLEIEEIDDRAGKFNKIVVGFVKEAKKHPNADKLSLCTVNNGSEDLAVVCGAPNVATGQKVVLALVGAVIPNGGMKIERAKIRGQISFGMLCSDRELGISDDHSGIKILDPDLKEGTPIAKVLGLDDVILEIAITPNRPDALSHIGIARELSALLCRGFNYPAVQLVEPVDKKSSDFASVEILDQVNCPRYVAKVILNVEIKESPEWLKSRIKSIGLRPINNVVDVTNFILYEVGQPLHAFDLDYLAGRKIVVRDAGNEEKFTTLDSKERKLRSADLMIWDGEKAVAIAGIMGGENSEVSASTKNILIESAYFNPSSVRKTSKMLGLSTDASYRFERSTDPDITVWAARRAVQLIFELGGGEIASGEIDIYPAEIIRKKTSLRFQRIDKILGYHISSEEVERILVRLGFLVSEKNSDSLEVEIPLFRPDIEREIDLIEEVARVYGYKKIPEINKISVTLEKKTDQSGFVDRTKDLLNSLGFYEIITNSLLNRETASKFGRPVQVLNPQSSEMSHLRPSLLPGMLTTISNNLKVNEKDLQLFEIGKIFEKITDGKIENFDDFSERQCLIISLTGNPVRAEWFEKDRMYDIYDLKGLVQSFFESLLTGVSLRTEFDLEPGLFYKSAFNVSDSDGRILGYGGKLKKEIAGSFDIEQDLFIFETDLDILKSIDLPLKSFTPLLKYPKVFRDFAFILDNSVSSEDVIKVIKEASSNLLHNIKLFDIFQSESLGKGKKSLAFQLEYYDSRATLTEDVIDNDFRSAIKAIEEKLKGKLRGS
jgi:phenylalanyl-tRNA synthetase beta chain